MTHTESIVPPGFLSRVITPGRSWIEKLANAKSVTAIPSSRSYDGGRYSVILYSVDGVDPWNFRFSHYEQIRATSFSIDLSDTVVSIEIISDDQTAFTTVKLRLTVSEEIARSVNVGDWILVFGPYFGQNLLDVEGNVSNSKGLWGEIERAQIVTVNTDVSEGGYIEVIAKDPAYILAKSKIPYLLPAGTLTERLRHLRNQGIILLKEPLIETEYELRAARGGRQTVWQDIMFDLGETNSIEDKRYVLRHREGEFYLQEISNQRYKWAFEVGNNIFNLNVKQSIENYFNQIHVMTNEDSQLNDLLGMAEDPTSLKQIAEGFAEKEEDYKKFGKHVTVLDSRQDVVTPTAQAQADKFLKDFGKPELVAGMITYALPGVRWGDQILIYEPVTRLSGVYWIRAVSVSVTQAQAIMTVDVAFEQVYPDHIRSAEAASGFGLFDQLGYEGLEWEDDE